MAFIIGSAALVRIFSLIFSLQAATSFSSDILSASVSSDNLYIAGPVSTRFRE